MAKSVWVKKEEVAAYEEGFVASMRGFGRVPLKEYPTYNERAAFNDGWDTHSRACWRPQTRKQFTG